MKKQVKQTKLVVNAETIRNLTPTELPTIGGGGIIFIPGVTYQAGKCAQVIC
jgi:hypothetical protein